MFESQFIQNFLQNTWWAGNAQTSTSVQRTICVKSPSGPASACARAVGAPHTDSQCLPVSELLIISTLATAKPRAEPEAEAEADSLIQATQLLQSYIMSEAKLLFSKSIRSILHVTLNAYPLYHPDSEPLPLTIVRSNRRQDKESVA